MASGAIAQTLPVMAHTRQIGGANRMVTMLLCKAQVTWPNANSARLTSTRASMA